ncbi:hypothetical protein [Nocardiopsis rhodophaea]|uniref:hypothetical protein n=1 Tax=Nocardiopsis rhodophaea TaxID=280238 RepID=UPI00337E31B8
MSFLHADARGESLAGLAQFRVDFSTCLTGLSDALSADAVDPAVYLARPGARPAMVGLAGATPAAARLDQAVTLAWNRERPRPPLPRGGPEHMHSEE